MLASLLRHLRIGHNLLPLAICPRIMTRISSGELARTSNPIFFSRSCGCDARKTTLIGRAGCTERASSAFEGDCVRNDMKCMFDLALQQVPKPTRLALIGADVEYSRNALDGARENAKALGFDIVFERSYPLSTIEFTSVARALQAAAPDVVYEATLPIDTAGIIRAAHEINFRPKLIGGSGNLLYPFERAAQ
jgi:Periplasmic binding protein